MYISCHLYLKNYLEGEFCTSTLNPLKTFKYTLTVIVWPCRFVPFYITVICSWRLEWLKELSVSAISEHFRALHKSKPAPFIMWTWIRCDTVTAAVTLCLNFTVNASFIFLIKAFFSAFAPVTCKLAEAFKSAIAKTWKCPNQSSLAHL